MLSNDNKQELAEMFRFARSPRFLFTFLVAATVVYFVVYFLTGTPVTEEEQTFSLKQTAAEIIEICKDSDRKDFCYEEEVPKLQGELETAEMFELIREIRRQDPEYLFCHVLAHSLGEYEVALDPNNWIDAIAKGPTDGLCSNGYTHGAILARFNYEEFTDEQFELALEDFAIACEERESWHPTTLTRAMCYHGLGHVFIHITETDVDKSIMACDRVAHKEGGRDFMDVCLEGIYMQLFQPLEPEDFWLLEFLEVQPSRDNIAQFCSDHSSTDRQYAACWREAWPFFFEEMKTSEGLLNYCNALEDEGYRQQCFVTAVTINGRLNLGNPNKMADVCNGLPSEQSGLCLSRGANAYVEEDHNATTEALNLCSLGDTEAAREECYGFLARIASYNFHRESEAFKNMCSNLPERWQDRCYSR